MCKKTLFSLVFIISLVVPFSARCETPSSPSLNIDIFVNEFKEGGYIYTYPEGTTSSKIEDGALVIRLDVDNYSGAGIGKAPSADISSVRFSGAVEFLIKGKTGGERCNIALLDSDALDNIKTEVRLPLSPYVTITHDWQKVSIPLADFSDMGEYWDGSRMQVSGFNWKEFQEVKFSINPNENREAVIYIKDLRIIPESQKYKEQKEISKLYFKESEVMGTDSSQDGCFIGVFRPKVPQELDNLNDFEKLTGKKVAFVFWYLDWASEFPVEDCRKLVERGYLPLIAWEPWLWNGREKIHLDNIINGEWDEYIKRWANAIKDYNKPLLLRWAHEFNGDWYPWSTAKNGRDPNKYVAAYRHIHDIFTKIGATNVKWIWVPDAKGSPYEKWNYYMLCYPGDEYVDWIGIDGYNWGVTQPGTNWESFKEIFEDAYFKISKKFPNKPIMIPEFASAELGGDKGAWIKEMDKVLKNDFPRIKAIGWFDIAKETDWRINSSIASTKAYQEVIRDKYYLTSADGIWKCDEWFAKNQKKLPVTKLKKTEAKIFRTKGTVDIDGDLSEYRKPSLKLDKDDLSGEIYLLWDDENLYLAARVIDDIPFVNDNKGKDIWNGDCVEVTLGTDEKADPDRAFFEKGDYQFGLSPGNGRDIKPSIWIWGANISPTEVKIISKKTENGYVIESKIPFSVFKGFRPQAGRRIGFDAALDDADISSREIQMVWSGSKNFYQDPSQWGIAIFAGRPIF